MSKRTDKKKQKRFNESFAENNSISQSTSIPVSVLETETPAKDIDIFIQYQNHEYLEKEIIEKVEAKCKSEGKEVTDDTKLCIYIKPEDKKAYFTYSTLSGFVEL